VKKIDQTNFCPPNLDESDSLSPLVVHRRKGTDNRSLVIFVHGLSGDRYGTWGKFPHLLFDDCPHIDLGAYAYRTALKRAVFWKSISLSREAEIFAQELRDDDQYKQIILIGHSMGGLLCKSAIKWLHEAGATNTLDRLNGLVLMDVPQAGSVRRIPFLDRISSDAAVLKAHGEFVTNVTRMFQNHIWNSSETAPVGKVHLPTWALKGASDFWVDRLSAGLDLPDCQMKTVHGSHTSIVKPVCRENEGYKYVRDCIEQLCPTPKQIANCQENDQKSMQFYEKKFQELRVWKEKYDLGEDLVAEYDKKILDQWVQDKR